MTEQTQKKSIFILLLLIIGVDRYKMNYRSIFNILDSE